MSRMYNKNNKLLARQLRSNMTKEEKTLWYRYLRNCRVRFLRQKPIGDYIVDFYWPKLHLVIELVDHSIILTMAYSMIISGQKT